MLRVATPLVSVPVPNVVEPLMKVTVPVGGADPVVVGVMVAVKVTLCPKTGAAGREGDGRGRGCLADRHRGDRRSTRCKRGIAGVLSRDRVGAGREGRGRKRWRLRP